jgi:DNA-binding NtrC family response regulator
MNGSILIYDPDEFTRESLKNVLAARFPLIVVEDRAQCLASLTQKALLSLAFLSIHNEEDDLDLELFTEARKLHKGLPVIALGNSTLEEEAVEALQHGATGYMLKPLQADDVRTMAMKANPSL